MCFRMELDTGYIQMFTLKAFHGFIICIDERDIGPFRQGIPVNSKAMVLGRDKNSAILIPDRLV